MYGTLDDSDYIKQPRIKGHQRYLLRHHVDSLANALTLSALEYDLAHQSAMAVIDQIPENG